MLKAEQYVGNNTETLIADFLFHALQHFPIHGH